MLWGFSMRLFSTLRSITCALWPLQLLALFFALCELVSFALKLKRAWSASSSVSGIVTCGTGLGFTGAPAGVANAATLAPVSIADVVGGNSHQRRTSRRAAARRRGF